MERLIERCSGLDVHRDTVAACVRVPGAHGQREQHVRTFGTTTAELLILRDWLEAHGVTHVAMESTGVYWKPVFYVLEEAFTCLLVNAAHIKQVPGRKTDVLDCIWIAQLLEHGLLRGSFVPPAPIRELRDLTRHRKVLIQERQRAANRLHKLLQDAGLKLASVATDILGVSGRAMLGALVEGTTDPGVLADLARGKLRKKLPALRQALAGRFRPHHAFLVGQLLAHVDYLDEAITTVSEEIEARLAPFEAHLTRLDTVHGIARRTAEVIIAEIGVDMTVFPNEHHLASWAGMCPGNNESAGKHKSGKTRKGDRWLRTALVEAAAAAIRTKDSALAARYRRVMRHRGHKKAVVAVAHAMLRAVYHVLADGTPYRDPGPDYYDRRHAHRVTRRAIELLERQGYRVVLELAA
ncbi:MAG TPA: IS110 family transposase [Methylomirabilota bacterium]|jgi:transposase|nr:IS110 family transposase [Methylomirabilota bacterium]